MARTSNRRDGGGVRRRRLPVTRTPRLSMRSTTTDRHGTRLNPPARGGGKRRRPRARTVRRGRRR